MYALPGRPYTLADREGDIVNPTQSQYPRAIPRDRRGIGYRWPRFGLDTAAFGSPPESLGNVAKCTPRPAPLLPEPVEYQSSLILAKYWSSAAAQRASEFLGVHTIDSPAEPGRDFRHRGIRRSAPAWKSS